MKYSDTFYMKRNGPVSISTVALVKIQHRSIRLRSIIDIDPTVDLIETWRPSSRVRL